MSDSEEWAVWAAEEFDEEGWLYLPRAMTALQREEWIAEARKYLNPLVGVKRWDGTPTTPLMLEELLESAIGRAGEVEALATFHVWPIPGPAALLCHICVVPSETAQRVLSDPPAGVAHRIDAEHIGAGVQFGTRASVETDEGVVDFYSVDLIFDDGVAAVVITLEQSLGALISNSYPGLATLKDVLQVQRPDGSAFASVEPNVVVQDEIWKLTGS